MRLIGGEKSLLVAHLEHALDQEGCAVCRMAAEAERRYLFNLLYERVNDGRTQEKLVERGGFCPRHTAMLLEVAGRGSHAKLTILLKGQVDALLGEIPSWPDQSGRRDRDAATVVAPCDCPACAESQRTVALYTAMLADRLRRPRMRELYAASDGFCHEHLRLAYDAATNGARAWLRENEGARLERLSHDMAEFIRKSAQWHQAPDGNGGGREPFGDERTAWIRALRVFNGAIEQDKPPEFEGT